MGLSPINRLENFDCSNNKLVDLEFLEKIHDAYYLKKLNIGNNNFPPTDIEKIKAFSFFINLEILNIGTDDQERLSQGIRNRFYGSLKALQHLTKLKILGIVATDIDNGLEHLTDGLQEIFAFPQNTNTQVIKIFEELRPFNNSYPK